MTKIYYSFFLILFIYGCASNSFFVRDRDYDVGRNVNLSYATPIKIIPFTQDQDKYLFEMDKGRCQWIYYVNKKTNVVESWEYVSTPDRCKLGISWFDSW